MRQGFVCVGMTVCLLSDLRGDGPQLCYKKRHLPLVWSQETSWRLRWWGPWREEIQASDTGTRGPWLGLEVLGTEGEGWGAGGGGAPAVDTRGGASPAACTQDLVADDAFLVGLWGVACTVLNIFRKG